jgi:apolipoprotein N-acyltransferase
MNKYLALTTQAAKDKPDLIIWPEAALPVVLEEEPNFFEKVKHCTQGLNAPLLLGAVTTRDNFYYNSAILVGAGSKLLTRYDKLHLVPFGEYIPLKKILPFLETVVPIGDITAGKEYTIFCLGNGQTKFSVLICFEDLFPELSREFIKRGANFLVNITNDAWYKRSSAAQQHFQASVFRAVENRVYLARAANTGVSGFIAPSGEIFSLAEDKAGRNIFIDGFDTEDIFMPERPHSFYTRYGDIFSFVCLLFIIYGSVLIFKNKR